MYATDAVRPAPIGVARVNSIVDPFTVTALTGIVADPFFTTKALAGAVRELIASP